MCTTKKDTAKPVSLQFANLLGSNPSKLPIPGDLEVLGVKAPSYADDGTLYMLPDGSIWEYLGISGYAVDNRDRVNGWKKLQQ